MIGGEGERQIRILWDPMPVQVRDGDRDSDSVMSELSTLARASVRSKSDSNLSSRDASSFQGYIEVIMVI